VGDRNSNESVGAIAAELEGSSRVEFVAGGASYKLRNILAAIGITPEAYE